MHFGVCVRKMQSSTALRPRTPAATGSSCRFLLTSSWRCQCLDFSRWNRCVLASAGFNLHFLGDRWWGASCHSCWPSVFLLHCRSLRIIDQFLKIILFIFLLVSFRDSSLRFWVLILYQTLKIFWSSQWLVVLFSKQCLSQSRLFSFNSNLPVSLSL